MLNEKGKRIVDTSLKILSGFMLYKALLGWSSTTGTVQGSEFGLLITLVNMLSLVMAWLALFTLRSLELPSWQHKNNPPQEEN